MARARIAIRSRDHLKRWLTETGRNFIVFDAVDFVDSLPEPFGDVANPDGSTTLGTVTLFQQFIASYRDHRRTVGAPALMPDGTEVMKSDVLEPEEYEVLIGWARRQQAEALDARRKLGAAAKK